MAFYPVTTPYIKDLSDNTKFNSCCDLSIPRVISSTYLDGLWLVDGVLGTILCKFVLVAWGLSTFVSILSMSGIAADRFYAVLSPMKPALFSHNKCALTIAAIWIASVAFQAHFLYAAKLVAFDTSLKCTLHWEPSSYTRYIFLIDWILYILCLTSVSATMLTVQYSSIIIFLYRHKNNLHFATEVIKRRVEEN